MKKNNNVMGSIRVWSHAKNYYQRIIETSEISDQDMNLIKARVYILDNLELFQRLGLVFDFPDKDILDTVFLAFEELKKIDSSEFVGSVQNLVNLILTAIIKNRDLIEREEEFLTLVVGLNPKEVLSPLNGIGQSIISQ